MTALDDSPEAGPLDLSPPAPPRPRPSLSPFGWGSPPEESLPESLPAGESPSPLPGDDGLSPGADDWSDEASDEDENGRTSSPASFANPVSKAALRKTAAQAVKIGGGMAHTVAAKTPEAQALGLYLADDDDAANIGHPLADIMHRRGDVVGGKLSPDANSALQAFLGLAGYLTKQVTKVSEVRQIQAAGGLAQPPAVAE